MSSGVPTPSTVPPPELPSGPMSISQSAVLITSRLCSITKKCVRPLFHAFSLYGGNPLANFDFL